MIAAAALASFFVCILAIVALRPIAVAVDLVDRPGGRKTHHGEVPIVGGLAMFLGLAVGLGLVSNPVVRTDAFIAACALLVTAGLIDDRFDLSPWLRLPVQVAATLMVAAGANINPTVSFGDPLGMGAIVFEGAWAYPVILLFVVGAINAFNMLDGMDGLAGAVSLVALAGIAAIAFVTDRTMTLYVSLVLAGAVSAFLLFNLPLGLNKGLKCFMGDAGSTLIGFVLALLCMNVTQGPDAALPPVSVLWLVALPIYELLWTIIRRASRRQSPFTADREHFHHLMLDAGFSVRGAFILYVFIATGTALFGIGLHYLGMSESLQFAMFMLVGAITARGMYEMPALIALLPVAWKRDRDPAAVRDSAT